MPEIGAGMYGYVIPHNQVPYITTSLGYKDVLSFDYMRTSQGQTGYGYTVGISTSPKLIVPVNISISMPNNN